MTAPATLGYNVFAGLVHIRDCVLKAFKMPSDLMLETRSGEAMASHSHSSSCSPL